MRSMRNGILVLLPLAGLTWQLPGQAKVPTLRPRPELVIDGRSSRAQFTFVTGACTVANRVLVTLSEGVHLKLWALTGEFLQSVGGPGSGPGEFRQAVRLGCRADVFWVFDRALSRITSFDAEGRLLKTQPVYRSGIGILLPDGATAIVPVFGFGVNPMGIHNVTFAIHRVSSAGDSSKALFTAPTYYRVLNVPVGNRTITGPQPFDDGGLWAFSADGSTVAFVERPVGKRTYEVTIASWQGDTLLHRSYSYKPVRLPDDLVEKEARFRLPPSGPKELLAEIRKALFKPRYVPTISRLAIGRDGSVWLRREDVGEDQIRWTVLERTGVPAMEVILPRDFDLLEASETAVLGVTRDSDDVPSIVRFRRSP